MRDRITSLLSAAAVLRAVVAQPDPTAEPWPMNYSSGSVGPDGPWTYLHQFFDYPIQSLAMQPALTTATLFVPVEACGDPSAKCPRPLPSMYVQSGAQNYFEEFTSEPFPANRWDNMVAPLRLQGSGHWIHDRIALKLPVTGAEGLLDNNGILSAEHYAVTYPGGAFYTMDVGMLSLAADGDPTFTYPLKGHGSKSNRMIPSAYQSGFIPSTSYGLHIGSAHPKVQGTLHLGGYDRSRCLTDPITTEGTPELVDISLEVADGASAYADPDNTQGLLRTDGGSSDSIMAMPNPSLPYLYLPKATCDAIAAQLPVTYNADFNLYLWDTASPFYHDIITSPHYMSFTFATDGGSKTSSIAVPFALLNLTLEAPLSHSPTSYFPCSPYTPGPAANMATSPTEQTYHLGRAFLQSAFLSHNWHQNLLFLAQAPGPLFPPPSVKTIPADATTLASTPNAPSWQDTWSGTLTALSARPSSGSEMTSGGSSTNSSTSASSSGLSTGAAAGIGIGVAALVLALLGLLAWLALRRRRRSRAAADAAAAANGPTAGRSELDGAYAAQRAEKDASERHRAELAGRYASVYEKYGEQARSPLELGASPVGAEAEAAGVGVAWPEAAKVPPERAGPPVELHGREVGREGEKVNMI